MKKLVYAQGGIELMSLGILTQLCELLPLYFLYSSPPPPPSLCGINKKQRSYEGQEGGAQRLVWIKKTGARTQSGPKPNSILQEIPDEYAGHLQSRERKETLSNVLL